MRRGWVGLLLLTAGCVAPSLSYWLPETTLVERFDYTEWDALLRAHVRDGVVDYPAFAGSQRFSQHLTRLRRARFTQDTTREQRMAFLANAYNALAIAAVLDGYSPASLIGRGRFFLRVRYPVGGEEITLWDLERHRLLPLGDPRVHFAIVCASLSCPKLASEALLPDRLEQQLERSARRFVNDPARNRFDREKREAQLAAIFERYTEDFAEAAGSVEAYVARYVDDPRLAQDLAEGRYRVRFLDDDWSLNGIQPPD